MNIRELDSAFCDSVNAYICYLWGGPNIATRGNLYDTSDLPGFVAEGDGALLRAILCRTQGDECECAALFLLVQGIGVGTRLLDAAVTFARGCGARRFWLITTNDNTQAIRFYQKYGLSLKAVHIGAFETTRRLKNEAPALGTDRIPIEHEFEFELLL